MEGVLIEAVGELPAGTAVDVVGGKASIDGRPVDAPPAAIAAREGRARRADVDGDGKLDRVFVANTYWHETTEDGDEVHQASTLVVALRGRTLLATRSGWGCGGEGFASFELVDVTGDGRPEVVAVVDQDTCEVGWTAETLVVLGVDRDLVPLAEVEAPVFPRVGPLTSGLVRWRPGRIERTVARECGDGCVERVDDAWTWDGAAFVASEPRTGPLAAVVDGRPVTVRRIDLDTAEIVDQGSPRTLPVEAIDFEVDALDADLRGNQQLPRVTRAR